MKCCEALCKVKRPKSLSIVSERSRDTLGSRAINSNYLIGCSPGVLLASENSVSTMAGVGSETSGSDDWNLGGSESSSDNWSESVVGNGVDDSSWLEDSLGSGNWDLNLSLDVPGHLSWDLSLDGPLNLLLDSDWDLLGDGLIDGVVDDALVSGGDGSWNLLLDGLGDVIVDGSLDELGAWDADLLGHGPWDELLLLGGDLSLDDSWSLLDDVVLLSGLGDSLDGLGVLEFLSGESSLLDLLLVGVWDLSCSLSGLVVDVVEGYISGDLSWDSDGVSHGVVDDLVIGG